MESAPDRPRRRYRRLVLILLPAAVGLPALFLAALAIPGARQKLDLWMAPGKYRSRVENHLALLAAGDSRAFDGVAIGGQKAWIDDNPQVFGGTMLGCELVSFDNSSMDGATADVEARIRGRDGKEYRIRYRLREQIFGPQTGQAFIESIESTDLPPPPIGIDDKSR